MTLMVLMTAVFGRWFSWLRNSLLTARQADPTHLVAQLHVSIEHGQHGPSTLFHLQVELCPADCGRGRSRPDLDIARFPAMKKVKQAAHETEPGLFSRCGWR